MNDRILEAELNLNRTGLATVNLGLLASGVHTVPALEIALGLATFVEESTSRDSFYKPCHSERTEQTQSYDLEKLCCDICSRRETRT